MDNTCVDTFGKAALTSSSNTRSLSGERNWNVVMVNRLVCFGRVDGGGSRGGEESRRLGQLEVQGGRRNPSKAS